MRKNYRPLVFLAAAMIAFPYSQCRAAPLTSEQMEEAQAEYNMGKKSYYGTDNLAQNTGNAAVWFEKSAKLGLPEAQYMLAQMYQKGEGVAQSDKDAFKWYGLAAAQGNAEAQARLGEMYVSGRGAQWDYALARSWCLRAARQGVAAAQTGLGLLYLNGNGGPQDYAEAYFWLTVAAQRGAMGSEKALAQAGSHLSNEQINQLRNKAGEWQPVTEQSDN